jgi:hypothetical protein
MKMRWFRWSVAAAVLAASLTSGCHEWVAFYRQPSISPLGTQSDSVWRKQEANGEASDFVIYQHEFQRGSVKLNLDGEDHVKEIAARLLQGQEAPVVVERSRMSPRKNTEYHYPVHANPGLDMNRREMIVRALTVMGVTDADDRVVVAPAYAAGMQASEAEAAYRRGLTETNYGNFGGFSSGGAGVF